VSVSRKIKFRLNVLQTLNCVQLSLIAFGSSGSYFFGNWVGNGNKLKNGIPHARSGLFNGIANITLFINVPRFECDTRDDLYCMRRLTLKIKKMTKKMLENLVFMTKIHL